jgi:glycosyltransferase involved in cell wall biosynthesis
MRIVLLASSGQLGGAERVVLAAAGALRTLGHQPVVFAPEEGPLLEAARGNALECATVPMPAELAALGETAQSSVGILGGIVRTAGSALAFRAALGRALGGARAEVLHAHGVKANLLAAWLPRRVPVIWHLHDYVGLRPASRWLLGIAARGCDLAIAVSADVARDARQWLPRTPVAVVHNPVDHEQFTPGGPALDLDAAAHLTRPRGLVTRIGLPAAFASWKGHAVFLEALARLGRSDVRGYIIGGAIYRTPNQCSADALTRRVTELGLDGRVGLTGVLNDMPGAYRALDIVVHASTRPEPFGLVIPEAMACGRLVVAVRSGGAAELFEPEVNAVGLAAADPSLLASTLEALLADPGRRARIAAAARDHVLRHFSPERFAASLGGALRLVNDGAAVAAR